MAILLLVLALRLPFLNQAIQGDDYYYLSGAMHAQIDPLHPTHGEYVFGGQKVDMRGHPHPPLNMWVLGGLLALIGDIEEVPFHAAYVLFSLLAAWAMWQLALRFSSRPVLATLFFLAVPAFLINGNSLESDIPFLAFWMLSVALFVRAVDRRSTPHAIAAVAAMAPAALAAYQSVLLLPILGCYLLLHDRRWLPGWAVLLTPGLVLGAWQLFERVTGGAAPAGVLAGYFETYGFQALANKADNAVALTAHAGWMLFPPLALVAFGRKPVWPLVLGAVGAGAGAIWLDPHPVFWLCFGSGIAVVTGSMLRLARWRDRDQFFLSAWITIFFVAALVLFFAGSARYLLPMAAPVCLLASRSFEEQKAKPLPAVAALFGVAFALQLGLGLGLAAVNYHHWDSYRRFAWDLADEIRQRRVWVNAEWGLRYYAESLGAVPLELSQPVQPGEAVLTSEISYPVDYTTGGGSLTPIRTMEIETPLPVRLIGIGARSGYSTVTLGYRPFAPGYGLIDRVSASVVVEHEPALSYVPMAAPEAETQIVSGIYRLENDAWRWMSDRGVLLLAAPEEAAPVEATIYIPEQSPAREIVLRLDGAEVARETFTGPGSYSVRSGSAVAPEGGSATLEILADGTFSPPGDTRKLGVVLSAAGFSDAISP